MKDFLKPVLVSKWHSSICFAFLSFNRVGAGWQRASPCLLDKVDTTKSNDTASLPLSFSILKISFFFFVSLWFFHPIYVIYNLSIHVLSLCKDKNSISQIQGSSLAGYTRNKLIKCIVYLYYLSSLSALAQALLRIRIYFSATTRQV